MGPNDVNLTRVFVREPNTTVADSAIQVTKGLEVVVEAEAGVALFGSGAMFLTNVVVRDLTANNNIVPAGPSAGYTGNMAMPVWPRPDHQFVWHVPVGSLAGREDHVCEVITFLKVGIVNPDVEFATSELFVLTD